MKDDLFAWSENLHVTSRHVLLDGSLVPAGVTVEQGRVVSIERDSASMQAHIGASQHEHKSTASTTDLTGFAIVPAPLDLHLHGAGGVAVPPEGTTSELDAALARVLSAGGTVAPASYRYLATLPRPTPSIGTSEDSVLAACASLSPSAWCAGARVEGCFINPEKAGVWPPEIFCAPDITLLDEMIAACSDTGVALRIIDVAPELSGALPLIEHAVARGLIVSLAHTNATFAEATAGIDAGATLATHTFNAMRAFDHRDPGIVGAVMSDDRVACEIICDGVHVHPGAIAALRAAKGAERLVVISDASPLAGLPPGRHEWSGRTFMHDGTCLRDSEGRLAGSARLLTEADSVLSEAGLDPLQRLISTFATARSVLDHDRSLGLQVGDEPLAVRISL